MLDLLFTASLYILALIGGLCLVALILLLYFAYRYEIKFSIGTKPKEEPSKKVE